MYIKSRGIVPGRDDTFERDEETVEIVPPPGYVGSRFYGVNQKKNGRGIPGNETAAENSGGEPIPGREIRAGVREKNTVKNEKEHPLHFLEKIGKEELLIISLIILIAGEKEHIESDTILMLSLLLLAG